MAGFFEEAKRRKVYRVAVAYAVVAGGAIQLAAAVFPAWDLPSWALRLVIVFLLIGFPISVILAWALEITPEGIRPMPALVRHPRGNSTLTYNVFLSYSWSNSAERRVLADKIGAIENVKVLVDDDFISPGDPIHSTVLKMIDAADCLVVLLTREGLQSREVWDEITRAHDRNKVIIPILAEGTKLEEIPWHFRDLRWVPYDLKNFDFVVERVVAAIRKRANPPAGIDSPAVPIRIGPPFEARNILESPHPATLRILLGLSWLYWILTGPWPLLWLLITSRRDLDIWWTTATTFPHLYLHSTCEGLFLALCLRYPLGALFASSAFKKTMWAILPPIIVATLLFILNDLSIGPELYRNDPLGFWLPLSSALQIFAFMLSCAAVLLVGFRTITHRARHTADIRVSNRLFGTIFYGILWLPMRAAYEMQSIPDAREIVHSDNVLRVRIVIFLFIVVEAVLVLGGFYKQRRYLVPVVAVLASSVIVLVALLCPHICVMLFRRDGGPSIYYGMFVAGLICYVGMILSERKRHER
jgi:hypothetical protein